MIPPSYLVGALVSIVFLFLFVFDDLICLYDLEIDDHSTANPIYPPRISLLQPPTKLSLRQSKRIILSGFTMPSHTRENSRDRELVLRNQTVPM